MSIFDKDDVISVANALAQEFIKAGQANASLAKLEANRIAAGLALIHRAHAEGTISEEAAKAQVSALQASEEAFLSTQKAINKVDRVLAIKAAFGALGKVLNKAIGFKLLPEG